ncbi:hypothetical protein BH11GEM1_BH11GEM1_28860 [soil metagenome]
MRVTTSRWFAGVIRAGLAVSLAGAALALSPREALATVVMCNAAGKCVEAEGSCAHWWIATHIGGWTCFTVGPIAVKPDVFRETDGTATVMRDKKTHKIASDELAEKLANFDERYKKGVGKQETEEFAKTFAKALESDKGKKVSDKRLQQIANELRVKVEARSVRPRG